MRCRRCDCQCSACLLRSRDWIELRIGNDFPASIEKTAGLHRVFMARKHWQSKVRFEGAWRRVGPPCRWERLSNSTSLLRTAVSRCHPPYFTTFH